jgi:CHAT domain-containing protein
LKSWAWINHRHVYGSIRISQQLFGVFDDQIKGLEQLYIAPDGILNLISFAALRLPDGRFFVERQPVARLQCGRDLLRGVNTTPAQGLVAMGGVDYGSMTVKKATTKSLDLAMGAYSNLRTARELDQGIAYLEHSKLEAETIAEIYSTHNKQDKPVLLIGKNASEQRLKKLKQPPRILHLSTHGFYLASGGESDLADEAPLLLSGLTLAGANQGLKGGLDKDGNDGLLYSLEVLGLNLQGTELVSLSACDTGKGVIDYSEGVYGLVRAFRIAGAQSVLMTLRPVGDRSSREFMETFYENWLGSPDNPSPSEALHQTRLDFIRHENLAYRKPVVWSSYVMVGRLGPLPVM